MMCYHLDIRPLFGDFHSSNATEERTHFPRSPSLIVIQIGHLWWNHWKWGGQGFQNELMVERKSFKTRKAEQAFVQNERESVSPSSALGIWCSLLIPREGGGLGDSKMIVIGIAEEHAPHETVSLRHWPFAFFCVFMEWYLFSNAT